MRGNKGFSENKNNEEEVMKLPITERISIFGYCIHTWNNTGCRDTSLFQITGAEKTVIAERIFNQIKSEERPKVVKKGKLVHAGGGALKDMGKCHIEITLGKLKFKSDVIIADIKDDALLGMDILNSGSKPADIYSVKQNNFKLGRK